VVLDYERKVRAHHALPSSGLETLETPCSCGGAYHGRDVYGLALYFSLANSASESLPLPEGAAMQSVGTSEFNLENLHKHLQRLSDDELIQFGKACRGMLTPQANLGRPPREVFVIQLQEARKEWRRRHPKV
jgi:hypothetical protein